MPQKVVVPHFRSLSWKGEVVAELKIPNFSLPWLWNNPQFVFEPMGWGLEQSLGSTTSSCSLSKAFTGVFVVT